MKGALSPNPAEKAGEAVADLSDSNSSNSSANCTSNSGNVSGYNSSRKNNSASGYSSSGSNISSKSNTSNSSSSSKSGSAIELHTAAPTTCGQQVQGPAPADKGAGGGRVQRRWQPVLQEQQQQPLEKQRQPWPPNTKKTSQSSSRTAENRYTTHLSETSTAAGPITATTTTAPGATATLGESVQNESYSGSSWEALNLQEHQGQQQRGKSVGRAEQQQLSLDAENEASLLSLGRNVCWISSEEITHCNRCRCLFTVTKWKHHCRACGKVFCGECSTSRMRLPDLGYLEKVRVCDDCALGGLSSRTHSLQEDLDVKEQINLSLKKALEEKTRQLENCRGFLLHVENVLLAAQLQGPADQQPLQQRRLNCAATSACKVGDSATETERNLFAVDSTGSQDDFSLLVLQSEAGLRRLTERLTQYEKSFQDARVQLAILHAEKEKETLEKRRLAEQLRVFDEKFNEFRQTALERDALRNLLEEQRAQLAEQKRQVDGLQQRCRTLESKAAAAATSPNSSTFPSSEIWRSSKGDFDLSDNEHSCSRRRITLGRSFDLDDLAVAFTVADGVRTPREPPSTGLRSWWQWCCRCCIRRRRRRNPIPQLSA